MSILNGIKNNTRWILLIVIILLSVFIFKSYETETQESVIETELKKVATLSYLETKITESIEMKKSDDLEMYVNLSAYLNIDLSSEIESKIEKYNSFFNKSWRNTKEFSKSFVTGESESTIGLAASTTSDMLVVGDLRDITIEGRKMSSGNSYDKVTLGLASLGVGMTVIQVASAGGGTPLKVGTSILKFARKAGKLTKSFSSLVTSKLTKSIDFNKLGRIDFSKVSKIQEGFKSFSRTIDFSHTKKLFEKVSILKKNTSSLDTVSLLKYVDDQKDLKKMVKLSDKFGKNTKGVLKVLGKGVLKAGTKIIKYTTLLITQLISLFVSIVLFIFSFFSKVSLLRRFF